MQISVNGKTKSIKEPATLTDLVEQLELNPRQVAIEVNRELVPRGDHSRHQLNDGDELEIVTLAGGG